MGNGSWDKKHTKTKKKYQVKKIQEEKGGKRQEKREHNAEGGEQGGRGESGREEFNRELWRTSIGPEIIGIGLLGRKSSIKSISLLPVFAQEARDNKEANEASTRSLSVSKIFINK